MTKKEKNPSFISSADGRHLWHKMDKLEDRLNGLEQVVYEIKGVIKTNLRWICIIIPIFTAILFFILNAIF